MPRSLALAIAALASCHADDPDLAATAAATTLAPNILTAVTCPPAGNHGVLGEVGLPTAGDDLQGYVLPTSVFPDALCNDGSPAIMYFRPGTGTGLNSWLIELEGGGGCRTAQECADRWCSIDQSFGRQQMGSTDYVANTVTNHKLGIVANGIQSLTQGPYATYNHVFVHYCSSDGWSGTSPTLDGTADDPSNPLASVTFSTRFNGDAIFKAAIRVLRRDGDTLPTFSDTGTSMPDLDIATGDVVIAGGSAGGAGVIVQLDRAVLDLTAHHNRAKSMPFFAGLIDSAFPPQLSGLGYQFTATCMPTGCTWRDYLEGTEPYWSHVVEDSCPTYHAPFGDDYKCLDLTHAIRHHITTPFFVRQGERDKLLTRTYLELGLATTWSSAATGAMNEDDFAGFVDQQSLTMFNGTWPGEEPVTMKPGAFISGCKTHDPLHDDAAWFDSWAARFTWPTMWTSWRTGNLNAAIDDVSVAPSCACARGVDC